jgi:uncharacterized protein (DUF2249 family)
MASSSQSAGADNAASNGSATGAAVPLDALVQRTVVAFRSHPHVGNVMTHVCQGRWDELGRALRAILDPAATARDLSPLAENVVELMCAERGITGRLLKPYVQELLQQMLPAPVAARLRAHMARLFDELQTRHALPSPVAEPKEDIMTNPREAEQDPPPAERVIDVRELNPRIRHTIIFQLFEHLGRDSALQLVADHAPEPLHRQLQARYGSCGWTYLETGPDVWRVRLQRGVASAPAPAQHAP